MAITLLAFIFTVVLTHFLPGVGRVREFSWLHRWQYWVDKQATKMVHSAPVFLRITLVIGIPVLLTILIQNALHHVWFGFAQLIFSTGVLFYCWGKRDLDADVAMVCHAEQEQRQSALIALDLPPELNILRSSDLIRAVFRQAMQRWFSVLFWFVIFGPAGAVFYRCVQQLNTMLQQQATTEQPEEEVEVRTYSTILAWLHWPVAHLMALALAVAANFDLVSRTWFEFHQHKGRYITRDIGFLDAIADACVSMEIDFEYDMGEIIELNNPFHAMQDALAYCWRILIAWGAVLAIFVLAGSII